MLFNSIEFGIFVCVIFLMYWLFAKESQKLQNTIIVLGSYFFYAFWDWRFLILIASSSILDFILAQKIHHESNNKKRKTILLFSIFGNLGTLFFFKYFNFFLESFNDGFMAANQDYQFNTLSIILPVGISFYTFQTLSYTVDVYRRKINPTKDLFSFLSFVSFFPQLVAGPIEKAKNFLPQFYLARKINPTQIHKGFQLILWGLFKKVVIADTCAKEVDIIFKNSGSSEGLILAFGAVLFSVQVYCDFSGYSHIAVGTAKLFGINLRRNFALPFFSKNLTIFWRRWHISLTSWFIDYMYIPLSLGTPKGFIRTRNLFIVFLVSGFWHGANWTFVVWGLMHAVFLKASQQFNFNALVDNKITSFLKALFTFGSVALLSVLFRSPDLSFALHYYYNMFSGIFNHQGLFDAHFLYAGTGYFHFLLIPLVFVIEWWQRKHDNVLSKLASWNVVPRWVVYYLLISLIIWNSGSPQEFIYFQF
jgi:alginate O-acetyltransferase complex protein AlgI